MNLTQITVSYGETQSLPEYSNVKPSVTLTAMLDATDDPTEIEHQLWDWARDSVHAQIDSALEANGKAAKYSAEPRFQVLKTARNSYLDRSAPPPPKAVVIIPEALKLDRDHYGALVHATYGESSNLRYAHALRVAHEAAENYSGATLIDCSDGDLSRLVGLLPAKEPEAPPVDGGPDARGWHQADGEEDDRDLEGDDDDNT